MENDNKELMKLSLRLRTFSSHATVMYAKGTDYSILEVCSNSLCSRIFGFEPLSSTFKEPHKETDLALSLSPFCLCTRAEGFKRAFKSSIHTPDYGNVASW